MKFKTLLEIFKGESDIRSLKKYNLFFGKDCLFIERPVENLAKIKNYLNSRNIKEVFILTPENYKLSLNESKIRFSKEEYTKTLKEIIEILMKKKIKIVLHLHLLKDPSNLPYKIKLSKTRKALDWIRNLDPKVSEVGYGWWRFSHGDKDLEKITKELGLKLAKRRAHIYDSWLK